MVKAFRKLSETEALEIIVSYDERDFPMSKKYDRMNIKKSEIFYRFVEGDSGVWRMVNYT